MTVGELFAGIGGFGLGFQRTGGTVAWQVEIDAFARRVLTRHWPDVPKYEDVRECSALNLSRVDVLCFGFPCQDVSVAGQRTGLVGARTGLFYEAIRIADALKTPTVVIENVPGLLSSHGGRDFSAVLEALRECGYVAGAYRVLDSRFFRVAQRRRRVFLVGHRRTFRGRAGTVLFEPTRSHWDSAAREEARTDIAVTLRGRSHGAGVNMPGRGGEDDQNLIAFDNRWGQDNANTPTLRSDCHGGQPMIASSGERERALTASMHKRHDADTDTLIVFDTTQITSRQNRSNPQAGDPCHPLAAGAHPPAIASALTASAGHHGRSSPRGDGQDNLVYALGSHAGAADGDQTNRSHAGGGPVGLGISEDEAYSLRAGRQQSVAFALRRDPGGIGQGHNTTFPGGVRRLTPLECERLQGFPGGWTCLCGCDPYTTKACRCPDSARYRALGNAVTVTVIEWIARQLLNAHLEAAS